jgi:NAD(P)-dependent dehydrogenase (short-subunit alcohol dehydrogenase family)
MNHLDAAATALGYAGKIVVVAGGGGTGMGAATATLLVILGAEVTVLDLREPAYENARFRQTDLGSAADIDAAVAEMPAEVNALFNCQGISGTAPRTSPETVMAVNFLGIRHLTESLLARMPAGSAVASISSAGGLGWERKAAQILSLLDEPDIDSGLAWCGKQHDDLLRTAFPHAYAFSKQALILWTLRRAVTSIASGIRINVTSPGSTQTAMTGDFPDSGIQGMNHPSGRVSTTQEQAWPLLFLNSDAASYVNGVNIPVDGGNNAARIMARLDSPA